MRVLPFNDHLPKLDQFFGMIEDGLKAAEEMQEGMGAPAPEGTEE